MNVLKASFDKIEDDGIELKTKEQDLKVLNEEVAKLRSKIRNNRSQLAMQIAEKHKNKIVFNCGDHALILKSKRVEKLIEELDHRGYILIVEKEMYS